MPLPASKRELLNSFDAAFSKLFDELASVPFEQERVPGIEGGLSESPRVPWRPDGLSQAAMGACSASCR